MMKNRMNQKLVAVVLGLSMALVACKGGKPFPTEESSVGGKMTETGSEKTVLRKQRNRRKEPLLTGKRYRW